MNIIKNKVLSQTASLKSDITKIEYLSWWLLRFAMLAVYIVFTVKQEMLYQRNLVLLNLSLTFVIPLLRFISPKFLFTSKTPFRIQTHINVFVFMGSFLGHGFNLLIDISEYDKLMHIVSGGFAVFIGFELLKAFSGHEKAPAGIKTFAATGFSFAVMVIWEMIEFFADYFITGSNNQGYYKIPDDSMIFVKIFGLSKNFPDDAAVFDTNVDLFYALIGCAVCTVILYSVLRRGERRIVVIEEETADIC